MELQIVDSNERVRANNVVCLARTYAEHAEELGHEVPDSPIIFLKPNSALIFDGDPILIPPESHEVHHEVELAVIIGRAGRSIPVEQALDHVLGYAVMLDITARDIQSGLKRQGLPWTLAKGRDSFAPISAVMPAERVPDPQVLDLRLSVSGEVRQQSNTRSMLFSVAEIVAYVSSIMTLARGDIIATGTPEGVGPLSAGDRTLAQIEKVGSLRNVVMRAPD